MMEIPLRAVPAQSLAVVLGGQSVSLRVFARDWLGQERLYCDVAVDDEWMWQGRLCQTGQGLKAYSYLKFKGDLRFLDLWGNEDPNWQGLGERWRLVWGTLDEWVEWDKKEARHA